MLLRFCLLWACWEKCFFLPTKKLEFNMAQFWIHNPFKKVEINKAQFWVHNSLMILSLTKKLEFSTAQFWAKFYYSCLLRT